MAISTSDAFGRDGVLLLLLVVVVVVVVVSYHYFSKTIEMGDTLTIFYF